MTRQSRKALVSPRGSGAEPLAWRSIYRVETALSSAARFGEEEGVSIGRTVNWPMAVPSH
jgi:hypothetical protein